MAPPGRSSLVIRPHRTGTVNHYRAASTCIHGSTFHDLYGSLELIRGHPHDIWGAHQRQVHCHCPLEEVLIVPTEELPR